MALKKLKPYRSFTKILSPTKRHNLRKNQKKTQRNPFVAVFIVFVMILSNYLIFQSPEAIHIPQPLNEMFEANPQGTRSESTEFDAREDNLDTKRDLQKLAQSRQLMDREADKILSNTDASDAKTANDPPQFQRVNSKGIARPLFELDEVLVTPMDQSEFRFSMEFNGTAFTQTGEYISGFWQYPDPLWTGPALLRVAGSRIEDRAIGDIDGDGRDEIFVTAVLTLDDGHILRYWFTYDDAENNFTLLSSRLGGWKGDISYIYEFHSPASAPLADLHGWGHEAFLIMSYLRRPIVDYYLQYFVFVWRDHTKTWDYVEAHSFDDEANEGAGWHPWDSTVLHSESGDLDGDGREEVAIVTTQCVYVYDDYNSPRNFFVRKANWGLDNPADFFFGVYSVPDYIHVTLGDFNGDRKQEIAVFYNEILYIFDYDALTRHYYLVQAITVGVTFETFLYYPQAPHLHTIDVQEDGFNEILLAGLDTDMKRWAIIFWYNPESQIYELFQIYEDFPYGSAMSSATGDIDADGWDEVVFGVVGFGWGFVALNFHLTGFEEAGRWGATTGVGPIYCGNFNGNGVEVEYANESAHVVYPPNVLVAMAAPPTQVGISQDYGNTYTSYGKETSLSEATSSTVDVSLNTRVSFDTSYLTSLLPEAGEWLGLFGIRGSYAWFESSGETTTVQSTLTVGTYSTGSSQFNQIIYFRPSYDIYKYTIKSHPFDDTFVGMPIYLSMPNDVRIYTLDQETFNYLFAQVPENQTTIYIGNETFSHVVGHPETYLSRENASLIPNMVYLTGQGDEMTVGKSGLFNNMIITMEDLRSYGTTQSTSTEYSGGFTVFGFGDDTSRMDSSGTGYEISFSEACVIEGRIGHISDRDEWLEFGGEGGYKWGMCLYYQTHPVGGNEYLVINYFVADATPYYPSPLTTTSAEPSPFAPWYLIVATIITLSAIRLQRRGFRFKKKHKQAKSLSD
ncbi:MAG: FG-GAP repeat domain-containing protein [Candidatus Hodarchaeales archaeon]